MKISRPDIRSDALVDYGSSSFLKLPLAGYLSAIDITLIPPQIALANAVNNPKYRFITCCFSRRVGKTFIANIIGAVKQLEPGTTVLIIAPDYNLAGISWDLQQGFVRRFDLEVSRNNAKDRVLTLDNGSSIRAASVGRVDSAVGRSYDLIIFDEAALNNAGGKAFNINLRPTLDKLESKCVFISTPRGDNYFHEFFLRGFDDDFPDWASLQCDWTENPRALPSEIESAKRSMSKNEFAQEYLAEFTTFEGQIWSFTEVYIRDLSAMRQKLIASPGRVDIIAGLDIGFRDNTAMAVLAVVAGDPEAMKTNGEPDWFKRKDIFYLVDEFCNNQMSTEMQAAEVSTLDERYDIDSIFIDSAAQQTRFDFAQMYDISTVNAKKDKLAGINFVAGMIENGQLIVDEECREAIHCLFNYKWDTNSQKEKEVHDRASHMADAIRYAMYTYSLGYMTF